MMALFYFLSNNFGGCKTQYRFHFLHQFNFNVAKKTGSILVQHFGGTSFVPSAETQLQSQKKRKISGQLHFPHKKCLYIGRKLRHCEIYNKSVLNSSFDGNMIERKNQNL